MRSHAPYAEASPSHGASPVRPRWTLLVGAAVIAAVAVGATLLAPADASPAATGALPSSSASAEPSVAPSPSPTATMPPLPGFEAAAVLSSEGAIDLFDSPGAAGPSSRLLPWTYYGQPVSLLVVDEEMFGGEPWAEVVVPEPPNRRTAWVRADGLEVSEAVNEIVVYLAERSLELRSGGRKVLSASIAVGADDTPTPTGLFSVTDLLDFRDRPGDEYGPFVVITSGVSEAVPSYDGRPAFLTIRSVGRRGGLGEASTDGAILLGADALSVLADAVSRGTPVLVLASSDDAD